MNFSEKLAYWYLRLNGFFPLTNFVLHQAVRGSHTADADVLGVRFKHVYEPIGGQPDDWDDWFGECGIDLTARTTGLIVEVKTGLNFGPNKIQNSFSHERLTYAIRRFGFYQEEEANEVSLQLVDRACVEKESFQVAKILVTEDDMDAHPDWPSCYQLTLGKIVEFIERRMERYSPRKSNDRFRFPDDLSQFFAWKAGVDIRHEN